MFVLATTVSSPLWAQAVNGEPAGPPLIVTTAGLAAAAEGDAPAAMLAGGGAIGPHRVDAADLSAAFTMLGYEAVNLGAVDLRSGADAVRAVVEGSHVPVVSANVYRAGGQERIAKPFAVVETGGKKLAVTGITMTSFAPAPGLAIGDPLKSLSDVIESAKEQADGVVVLGWGIDVGLASEIAKAYPAVQFVVRSGPGLPDPRPMQVGNAWIIQGPANRYTIGRTFVTSDAKAPVRHELVAAAVTPDAAIDLSAATAAADPIAAAKPITTTAVAPPVSLAGDESQPYGATAGNRAAHFTVHRLAARKEYGPVKAAEGRSLLVLEVEFENIIPLTLVRERQTPTEYRIPQLGDHLYVVVNGRQTARLHPLANDLPGHVPAADFSLERIGSTVRGNAVFKLPAGEVETLEVRFYDYAHGHFTLPLVVPAGGSLASTEKPLAEPVKNEVLNAAVYGIQKQPKLADRTAPPSMQYITVDFRATSEFATEADASAFDPKAKPGAKMKVGTVADWTDAMKYATLVVDGEYGYAAITELSPLGESPRFLPDLPTGGTIAFLAPAETKSIELRCDVPNAKTPEGKVIRPKGLTLPIEGTRPALVERKPISEAISDEMFRLAVTGSAAAPEFGGQKAPEGQQFLVLDVSVKNAGTDGEFLQAKEQLKYATSAGEQEAYADVTTQGVHQPAELHWVPAGETRSFQVVYAIDAAEAKPRLAYNGLSLAKIIDLPALGAAVADAGAKPDAPATDKPEATPEQVATATPAQPAVEQPAVTQKPAEPAKPLKAEKGVTIKVGDKLFPARVRAKQERQPQGLEGVGLTPAMVNAAIDRGAEGLWKRTIERLNREREPFGAEDNDILVALALVHSNYHKKNPAFDAHLRGMLAKYELAARHSTYEIGIVCMIIDSYGDPAFSSKLRECAQWLLDQQGSDGTWNYGRREPVPGLNAQDRPARRTLMVAGGHPPGEPPAGGAPLKRRTPWEAGQSGDNSVTQYALLGLHAASRSGVAVPPETFQRLLKENLERQSDIDGGWSYHGSSYGYGSMTCAGICATAITRHELGEAQPWDHESVERGLAWLNARFMVDNHPENKDDWVYYYLYSLERVGRILDTEFIGEYEWYPLGAEWLLQGQKETGLWFWPSGPESELHAEIPTSFALLFLTRATESLGHTEKTGPGLLKTAVEVPPGNRLYVILDCSGSMLVEMAGRQKFEIAKDAVRALLEALPDNSEVAMRAYGYRLRAIEEGASEDSKLLVPMATLDRKKIGDIVNGLRARGKTPLAFSLEEAAKDLARMQGTEASPITCVLLTDGGEDSQPRRDPIKAAAEFGKLSNVKLRIVGFDINRADWSEQLQAMAKAAGGTYLAANNSEQLVRELKSSVFGIPEQYELFDEQGNPLAKAPFGTEKQLEPGKYTFVTTFAGKRFAEPFWVNAGSTTSITFDPASIPVEALGDSAPATDAPPATPPVATPPAPDAPTTPADGGNVAKKFCTNCGAALAPGAKFCTTCGAKVE
ncbi:MAG TPA: VWA domain-containing protein [Tepidisphaeraceae bacterium]|nr:VWA domain-containing protein [Tepidisphaeraceae bacterium]